MFSYNYKIYFSFRNRRKTKENYISTNAGYTLSLQIFELKYLKDCRNENCFSGFRRKFRRSEKCTILKVRYLYSKFFRRVFL